MDILIKIVSIENNNDQFASALEITYETRYLDLIIDQNKQTKEIKIILSSIDSPVYKAIIQSLINYSGYPNPNVVVIFIAMKI